MSTSVTPEERRARLEDLRFMADCGECLDGAARRMGMRPKSLDRFLRRWDGDLACLLAARNPRDPNVAANYERGVA